MINTAVIMGRLTADPELRTSTSKLSVVVFDVAVDRNYIGSDGTHATDFIHCVAWRKTAEHISQHFRRGQMIAIKGALQTRTYTEKHGVNRSVMELVAEHVSFCGDKKTSIVQGAQMQFDNESGVEDDLPF